MSRKKKSNRSRSRPGPFSSLFGGDSTSKRKKSRRGRRGKKKKKGRFLRRLVVFVIIAGGLAGLGGSAFYYFKSFAYDLEELKEVPERTLVYNRDGDPMGHVSGHGENRVVVPASEVSQHFIDAILAREDARFYEHDGIDYLGVVRAAIRNIKAGSLVQGASTLTMQLARNTFDLRELSLQRKMLEAALAKRIERKFTKDEILGFYMNRIYFGSGLYGIERAARGFFVKPASELTLGESAMLAGIIRGPSILNPFRSLEDAKATRDEVLDRMVAEKFVTREEADAAAAESITLRPPDERLATGSYVLQAVYDLLGDFLEPREIEQGGLRIHTTIDATLQESAEENLDGHLSEIERRSGFSHPPRSAHEEGTRTDYVQGAVVSLDNDSGAILALVGGRNFGDSSFNRAYRARRQAGSTFKPFVYAAAFQHTGLLPGAYVSDGPVRIETGGGPPWTPGNSDGTFQGLQPAAIGLIRSRNTMTVRVGQLAGLERVRGLAKQLKFGDIPESPVVHIGAFETTLYTLTSAFSTFPAGGINYTPFLIERIESSGGEQLFPPTEEDSAARGRRVLSESVSWVTTDVLGKVMDDGTGAGARRDGYTAPAYGKTGTTDDYHDAWFVGYTDEITTGVWVGMDQPDTIMNRGYGSTLALPVWTGVMKTAESGGWAAEKIPAPAGTSRTVLCRECGGLANRRTDYAYQMPLPAALRPGHDCPGHRRGLLSQRDRTPRAYPIGADQPARPTQPQPRREEEGGLLRDIGRFIFGGGGK